MVIFAKPDISPMSTISLVDRFGPVLVGRLPAMELRAEVEEAAARGEMIFLDFEGVAAISPSFGDEVFAKLDDALINEGLVTFLHVDAQLLEIGEILRRTRAA